MAEERSEEARAAGLLFITIGGSDVELPVLRIRAARVWKKKLASVDVEDAKDGEELDYAVDLMIDLLAEYDTGGILGGRQAIEDRATDREVYDAFKEVLSATFPFVKDSETMLSEEFSRLVTLALYLRGNSTNGASRNGASTPTPLKRSSRKSSSSSSGTRGKSA